MVIVAADNHYKLFGSGGCFVMVFGHCVVKT